MKKKKNYTLLLESFSGILGMHVNNEQKRKRDKDVKEELGRMEIFFSFLLTSLYLALYPHTGHCISWRAKQTLKIKYLIFFISSFLVKI
jgi:hypothetical protein